MNKNVVVIGSSGYAKVVIDLIEKEGKYNIIGMLDTTKSIGDYVFGYEVLGEEKHLQNSIEKYKLIGCVIAIGDNWIRSIVRNKIKNIDPNFKFLTIIHPSAVIARGVKIGVGSVIMAGVVINSNATIGDFCILNTNSSLDHDGIMGNFSSIAPNASTGGNVSIGDFSVISIGANIIHNISIGRHSVIGAGSTVLNDIKDYSVAYGTPAEVISTRKEADKYL